MGLIGLIVLIAWTLLSTTAVEPIVTLPLPAMVPPSTVTRASDPRNWAEAGIRKLKSCAGSCETDFS